MLRSVASICFLLAAWSLAAAASSTTEDSLSNRGAITPTYILTLAKQASEAESNSARREYLRINVAEAIKRLGREAEFGDDAKDVLDVARKRSGHWDDDVNRREAKRLFQLGDVDGVKRLLGRAQCIGSFCLPITDATLNILFFHWEIESGNLPAALHRLRTADWGGSAPIMAVQVASAYIVAGRQDEIRDLISEIDDRFDEAAEKGLLTDGAVYRRLSRTNGVTKAIGLAQAEQDLRKQVRGLIIVAEGLLGIPGLPDETLVPY
jgi:hypothetical protein